MLLRPGYLTLRRMPAAPGGPTDGLLAESGAPLLTETGLTLIAE